MGRRIIVSKYKENNGTLRKNPNTARTLKFSHVEIEVANFGPVSIKNVFEKGSEFSIINQNFFQLSFSTYLK